MLVFLGGLLAGVVVTVIALAIFAVIAVSLGPVPFDPSEGDWP